MKAETACYFGVVPFDEAANANYTIDARGNEVNCIEINDSILLDDSSGIPLTVTSLTAASTADQTVNLQWNYTKPYDFDHFAIYQSTSQPSTLSEMDWVQNITVTHCPVQGLVNGQEYYFAVVVADRYGKL